MVNTYFFAVKVREFLVVSNDVGYENELSFLYWL